MIDLRLPNKEDRPHEVFFLENGLQVAVVSDPEADQAAAALDVRVGSLSDPKDLPGMAHFLEHMLFLGTEKYPDENSYSSFLQQHGGHSNAYTAGESTNYYFDVVHNHLEEALDRFSQFFVAPLFTESATDRERNAIESEHSKNLQNDVWRIHQLLKSQINKEHPFSNFGTGNLFTLKEEPERLGIDMKARLFQFYEKHYSASIMKLAVVGRDPLPVLKEWITSKFSPIKTTGISPPYPPWKVDDDPASLTKGPKLIVEKNQLFKVVPVKESRQLRLLFPIPPQTANYRKNPAHYVSHLLGHEGVGSVLSVLKERGIGNSLVGGITTSQADFAVFSVSVDLSEKGFERWEEAAGIIFQYIRDLQKEGPKEWVFDELKAMGEIEFEMKEKAPATSYVGFLTSTMQLYQPEDLVAGPFLLHDYDPEMIKREVLDYLTTENCTGLLTSPSFKETADCEERWYKTQYSLDFLSPALLEAWGKDKYSDDLHEPAHNFFIPKDLEVKPLEGGEKEGERDPEVVYESPLSRLHHKQDTTFELPKMNTYLQFCVPHAFNSPWGSVATSLFVRLCEDALNQFVYDADIAGLKFSLLSSWTGIRLYVKGFNEKMDVLVLKILDTMFQLQPTQDRFDTLKEAYLREMRNFAIAQPYEHGRYYGDLLFHQVYWSVEEKLPQLEKLKIDDVVRIKESLFNSVKIEALMHGNITPLEAVEFVKKIEARFLDSIPLPLSQHPDKRIVYIPTEVASVFSRKGLSPKEVNSCIFFYLQIGPESVEANAIVDLFAQLLREPAFDTLRTKEQLGYIVFSSAHSAHCVQGIRIIVQSSVADPVFLEQRIEAFLSAFKKTLEDMSEETIATNIKSLIARKLEKDRHLSQETDRIWDSIIRKKEAFNMRELEAVAVGELKKENVLEFYNTYIAQKSPKRRKLSIHIFGCDHKMEEAGKGPRELEGDFLEEEEREQIWNYAEWKRGLPLYKNMA